MKRFIFAVFALTLAAAANAAWNQECFYGACCVNGVINQECANPDPSFCERKCFIEKAGSKIELIACQKDCYSKKGVTETRTVVVVEDDKLAIGRTVRVANSNFDSDKYELTPRLERYLARKAQELKGIKYKRIIITGHTDNLGDKTQNHALSLARAQTVANYFMKNGVPASKIKAYGKGASKPIADNKTEDGRAANRRVEIQVK